jgi:DNA repair protein RecN (Recombination protein N)
MLETINIKDFALIDHLQVEWTPGLNVLTGETGAGKSILIDALNTVLGGKAGPGAIRVGAEKAYIEATFKVSATVASWLKHNELIDEDPNVTTVAREITKSGSRVRINGTLVNHSIVQELGELLLTIHAQHEARTMMSPQYQLDLLDSLGDANHKKVLEKVRLLQANRRELLATQKELNGSEEDRLRKLDFSRFQLQELEEAELIDENEDADLDHQQNVLAHVAQLDTLVNGAYEALNGSDKDESVCTVDLLQKSLADIEKASRFDETLVETCTLLQSSLASMEEAASKLRRYASALDTDPETLTSVETRLGVLVAIKRKYGPSLKEALERRELLRIEIDKLENSQSRIDQIDAELAELETKLQTVADELTQKRLKLAKNLSQSVLAELVDLGMERCKFEIAVTKLSETGPSGQDRVEFVIAPNPGQPLLPLSKIASGGELSRVMLAIKTIFAHADQVSTVIFDEIDTGLSGRVLQSMRDKLARLAKSHQILCITHQPIIASVADNHIEVAKSQSDETTHISARLLNADQRLQALAAMASGQGDEEVSLNFARSLVQQANQLK